MCLTKIFNIKAVTFLFYQNLKLCKAQASNTKFILPWANEMKENTLSQNYVCFISNEEKKNLLLILLKFTLQN